MKTFDDFIKDANSILNILDKDYEAMQSQKSNVKQDQAEEFANLCKDMGDILGQYLKTIWDFKNKVSKIFDTEGPEFPVYEYPNTDKKIVIVPKLYWAGSRVPKLYWAGNRVPTFHIQLIAKPKIGGCNFYSKEDLVVSETGIEMHTSGFSDEGFSDAVSILLNHRPTYEQLDTAFQTAVTEYVKHCVTYIQKRNKNFADKIKSITR